MNAIAWAGMHSSTTPAATAQYGVTGMRRCQVVRPASARPAV
jgi:hypothetical protein